VKKPNAIRDFILEQVILGNLRAGDEIDSESIKKKLEDHRKKKEYPGTMSYRGALDDLAGLRIIEVAAGSKTTIRNPDNPAGNLRYEAIARFFSETLAVAALTSKTGEKMENRAQISPLWRLHDQMTSIATGSGEELKGVDDETRGVEFVLADFQFHREICKLSGTAFMLPVVSSLFWTFIIAKPNGTPGHHTAPDTMEDVCREHRFLLEFIEIGEVSNASPAMVFHLGEAIERINYASNLRVQDVEREIKTAYEDVFNFKSIDRSQVREYLKKKPVISHVQQGKSQNLLDRAESLGIDNRW